MKKQFKGKKILSAIAARLISSDNIYPDAICHVIMTEDTFYVIEDNYDGTFTYHFSIPLERIISVVKYEPEKLETNNSNRYTPSQTTAGLLALIGVFVFPGKGRQEARKIYLRIAYKNTDDKMQSLFFEDCSSIKSMVKAFNKKTDE